MLSIPQGVLPEWASTPPVRAAEAPNVGDVPSELASTHPTRSEMAWDDPEVLSVWTAMHQSDPAVIPLSGAPTPLHEQVMRERDENRREAGEGATFARWC